jgi:tripartite-type tricarboxylate transporter receptor subunit TctC
MPAEAGIQTTGRRAWIPAFAGMTIMQGLVLWALGYPADIRAQEWPARPVRWIVALPAGTAVDISSRLLAGRMSRVWGQQVVVDNRPGGQSVIGAQAAARSAPDGYNYFLGTTAALASNVHTFKSLPYDPAKDFVPVAMIGHSPFVIAVNPKVPAATIAELVALDRSQPAKLVMANQGARTFGGMVGQMLNLATGMKLLQVPYNATALAAQDTISGRVQVLLLSSGAIMPFLRRGDLRPLAVTTGRRVPGLDQVPTLAESIPGFEYAGWFVLVAPAGAPAAIVRRVNRDMDRLLSDADIVQRMSDLGVITASAGTPAALAGFLQVERERWGKLVREIGLEPE